MTINNANVLTIDAGFEKVVYKSEIMYGKITTIMISKMQVTQVSQV
ncbi:hypothetical protein [Macrococcoides canis]|nr:hypothetical protein [Macrococcus canis]